MDKIFNTASVVCGFVGGFVAWLFGGWDSIFCVLLVLMVLDYISGLIKGGYTQRLSSEIGFRGLLKKVMILVVVAMANVIQYIIGEGLPIREIVISFFIANEALSILENVAALKMPIPEKLKDALLQLRDKN